MVKSRCPPRLRRTSRASLTCHNFRTAPTFSTDSRLRYAWVLASSPGSTGAPTKVSTGTTRKTELERLKLRWNRKGDRLLLIPTGISHFPIKNAILFFLLKQKDSIIGKWKIFVRGIVSSFFGIISPREARSHHVWQCSMPMCWLALSILYHRGYPEE